MLDLTTTLIGMSFALLTTSALIVCAGAVLVAIKTLRSLPTSIAAMRTATELSISLIAESGMSVAEQVCFGHMQLIIGKYLAFGFCGIYLSVIKFFAVGANITASLTGTRAERLSHKTHTSSVFSHDCDGLLPALSKLSVVMKQ